MHNVHKNINLAVAGTGLNELQIAFVCRETLAVRLLYAMCTVSKFCMHMYLYMRDNVGSLHTYFVPYRVLPIFMRETKYIETSRYVYCIVKKLVVPITSSIAVHMWVIH